MYHLRLVWQRLNSNTDQTDCTDIPDLSSPEGLTYQGEAKLIFVHLGRKMRGKVSVRRTPVLTASVSSGGQIS